MSEITAFVGDMTRCDANAFLTDKSRNYIVSAKSMLGAVYSMEWDEVWCECDDNIFTIVNKYRADE
jgi:hypothetical protein